MIVFCGRCWCWGVQKPGPYLQPAHLQLLAPVTGIFYFHFGCQVCTMPPLKHLTVKMMWPASKRKNEEPGGGQWHQPTGTAWWYHINPRFLRWATALCVCVLGGGSSVLHSLLLCCWALLSLPPGILSVPNICLLSWWETERQSCLLMSQTQVLPVVYGSAHSGDACTFFVLQKQKIKCAGKAFGEHRFPPSRSVPHLHLYYSSSSYCI